MFETIAHSMPKVQGPEVSSSGNVVPMRTPAGPAAQGKNGSLFSFEKAGALEKREETTKEESTKQVTPKMLMELEQDIETLHNIGLQFSMHDETGRTMIKIMDKNTEKLIREIPSEEVLNLAAKIEEMIGILFDRKV